MSLTKKEIQELNVGNTVKVVFESKKAVGKFVSGEDGNTVCTGKVLGVSEQHIEILGYQELEYKVKVMTLPIGISRVTRSRITGDASKAVNNYYKKYVDYIKQKRKNEKLIRERREEIAKLKGKIDIEKESVTEAIKNSNRDKLIAGDEVYDRLYKVYDENYKNNPKYNLMLYSQPKAGQFTVVSLSDTMYEGNLNKTRFYVEYDHNTFVEGSQEDFKNDISKVWHTPKVLTDSNLSGLGEVKTSFDGDTDGGHRLQLRVDYNFNFNKPLTEEQIKKAVKFIEGNCFIKK